MMQEYAFLQNDDEDLTNLYKVANLGEKNLIIESFMTRALTPNELSFPVNMVMGSVHIHAFMLMLQKEW